VGTAKEKAGFAKTIQEKNGMRATDAVVELACHVNARKLKRRTRCYIR